MDLKQWVPSGPLGRARVGGRVTTPQAVLWGYREDLLGSPGQGSGGV